MKYKETYCDKKLNKILLLLSVLLISSVQTRTIVQPYSSLIFYNTATNSLRNPFLQRYVLYEHTDNYGRIVSYNSPEPVYVIRVSNYNGNAAPAVQNQVINEFAEAQEAHFRAWSLQQYQVLKLEIDALKAEGKEPSVEMLLRFIPLEKIAHTVDYSTIAHLPEIKQIRNEHFKIWQNVSISDLQYLMDNKVSAYIEKLEHQLKIIEDKNTKFKEINKFESIPKSFHRNPDHVISSEKEKENHDHRHEFVHKHDIKYAHLNKTEVIDGFKELTLVTSSATEIPKTNITNNIENSNDVTETPEVLFVARIDGNTKSTETMNLSDFEAEKQEFTTIANQEIDINVDQTELDQQTTESVTEAVPETTESQTIIVDHFQSISQPKLKNTTKNAIEKFIFNAPQIYVPQLEIDTEEVQRARDEHLSIISAAIFKAKLAHEENRKEEDDILPDTVNSTTAP